MATAAFWQPGESLDYKNTGSETIEENTIMKYGDRVAVAGCEIKPGQVGSLAVKGVFRMPVCGSILPIGGGADVYLDDDEGEITTTSSSNTKAGYAAQAAKAGDTEVLVNLNA